MRWLLAGLLAAVCSPLATISPSPYVPKPLPREISAEECMAWVVHSEARGESLRGARAVIDVVHARMKKNKKGACQIISARKQFSGYKKGVFSKVTDSMLDRYHKAVALKPVVKGCTFFHATYVEPAWKFSMIECGQVGNHIFYKEKPREPKRFENRRQG